jgi:hypothetical protein
VRIKKTNATELEQILTNLTIAYSRLLLRKKEQAGLAEDDFNGDIRELVGEKKLITYEELGAAKPATKA